MLIDDVLQIRMSLTFVSQRYDFTLPPLMLSHKLFFERSTPQNSNHSCVDNGELQNQCDYFDLNNAMHIDRRIFGPGPNFQWTQTAHPGQRVVESNNSQGSMVFTGVVWCFFNTYHGVTMVLTKTTEC